MYVTGFKSAGELVGYYKKKQSGFRKLTLPSSSAARSSSKISSKITSRLYSVSLLQYYYYCVVISYVFFYMKLNFAKYCQSGCFAFRMMAPGRISVPGFSDEDTYSKVLDRGSQGIWTVLL